MSLFSRPWGHRARSLALPLLAALALHALWLAWSSLRPPRPAGLAPLHHLDDTPELLVFSRQPPEPLPAAGVPPPPPSFSPPPPSLPPRRANRPGLSRSSARPAQFPRPDRRGSATRARLPQLQPPKAKRAQSAPAARLASAQPHQAGVHPSATADRPEGEALQRWRDLWRAAAAVDERRSPPASLVTAAAGGEVRWLPLARLRAEGLDPESGRVLQLDDARLLVWQEAETIWLVRFPLDSPSAP